MNGCAETLTSSSERRASIASADRRDAPRGKRVFPSARSPSRLGSRSRKAGREPLKRSGLTFAAAIAGAAALTAALPGATAVKPYVQAVGGEYTVRPLLSVDDKVPLLGGAEGEQYRMVGIPDGLGAHRNGDGTSTLFMNHELDSTRLSEPIVDGPKNRGAFVSQWILDPNGDPIAGRRAYDSVFERDAFVGPAPDLTNATPALARFCSGFLAGPANGFDRWIYLTNEEEGDAGSTFDGMGGVSVAVFDDELHTLPDLGHFAKENTVVQRRRGGRTVVFSTEDGPRTLDSQLYMYVGKKDRSARASVLERNGLVGGTLYVFRSLEPARNSERTFVTGSVRGDWVAIPNAGTLTDAELEAASDAADAMTFVRPEDGAFNPNDRNEFFFTTTGSSSGSAEGVNELGRLYSLRLHPGNPLKPATLTIVYNADRVVARGGDIAISPDNIDASNGYLMINEDPTAEGGDAIAAKGRDGSIWRFRLGKGSRRSTGVLAASATRVAELNPPGRDGIPVGPGVWESSGVIDASALFGADSWLSDVQAHRPTTPPVDPSVTVQDGQLFVLTHAP